MSIEVSYEFFSKPKFLSGNRALENIPFELDSYGSVKPLVITDSRTKETGLHKTFIKAMSDSHMIIGALFHDVPERTDMEEVYDLVRLYNDRRCDSIVAIGGGAVVHTAKAVNLLVSTGAGDILQFQGKDTIPGNLNPLVSVFSGESDGFEGSWEMVLQGVHYQSDYLVPHVVIVDPRFSGFTSGRSVSYTAMIALTHSIEARKKPSSNPFNDAFSSGTLQLIPEHLGKLIKNPSHKKSSEALANASFMGAISYSNSSPGVVHSCAIALSSLTGLHHGLLMGILLSAFLNTILDSREPLGEELLLSLGGFDLYTETPQQYRSEKGIDLAQGLIRDCGEFIPGNLREVIVDESLIKKAAAEAVQLSHKSVKKAECMALLKSAWQ
jgi:alcohol dehydrogenase